MKLGSRHLVVVLRGLCRDLDVLESGNLFVGELRDRQSSPVQTAQALVFLGGKQDNIVSAMTGHYDGLPVGDASKAAEFTLKFTRWNARQDELSRLDRHSHYTQIPYFAEPSLRPMGCISSNAMRRDTAARFTNYKSSA
jgi:hypothetical protein